ncbi:phospholipid scramblase-related protein [Rothia sp. SD9660Na]|uniref:LURP-one-related/scramblase family protein n=1 Tax=Rothia sp. SD9660Na TaxID=3047030 RepID=UPI0024B8B2CB|nr:phospholipid scramblase-related protein [Rothia sp. SD9660Na]WHS51234.1 phospholipid scramblase-related protein [Rothia sp. SD9660Na]
MSENTNKPGYQPQPVPENSQQGSSSLLTSNTLVVQQTRSFMSNDFEMQSQDGRVLGRVLTTGSTAGRLLKGNRTFDLVDDRGNLLIKIVDPFDFGLDRYELQNPDGSVFAHVQKQFSFMRKRLTIELPGLTLELEGSLFEYDFNITVNGHVAARVAREWGGLVAGLRGKSRYGVNFDPSAPEPVRLAILGGLVALDLIRAKDARN